MEKEKKKNKVEEKESRLLAGERAEEVRGSKIVSNRATTHDHEFIHTAQCQHAYQIQFGDFKPSVQ